MKQLLVIFTSLCVLVPVKAQDVLTLEECLRLGIENNLSLESSRNEIRKWRTYTERKVVQNSCLRLMPLPDQ